MQRSLTHSEDDHVLVSSPRGVDCDVHGAAVAERLQAVPEEAAGGVTENPKCDSFRRLHEARAVRSSSILLLNRADA